MSFSTAALQQFPAGFCSQYMLQKQYVFRMASTKILHAKKIIIIKHFAS